MADIDYRHGFCYLYLFILLKARTSTSKLMMAWPWGESHATNSSAHLLTRGTRGAPRNPSYLKKGKAARVVVVFFPPVLAIKKTLSGQVTVFKDWVLLDPVRAAMDIYSKPPKVSKHNCSVQLVHMCEASQAGCLVHSKDVANIRCEEWLIWKAPDGYPAPNHHRFECSMLHPLTGTVKEPSFAGGPMTLALPVIVATATSGSTNSIGLGEDL